MANITFTVAEVKPVFPTPGHCEMYNVEIGETITAGQVLCWDTDGQMILADGNVSTLDEPWAVALQGGLANEVISVLTKGHVYGFAVSGLSTGGLVTLTDTPGVVEEAGSGECVGRIVAISGGETTDYVIHFDFNTCLAGIE